MSDKSKPLTDRLGNPLEFGDPEFDPNPSRHYSPEANQKMAEHLEELRQHQRKIRGEQSPAEPEPPKKP